MTEAALGAAIAFPEETLSWEPYSYLGHVGPVRKHPVSTNAIDVTLSDNQTSKQSTVTASGAANWNKTYPYSVNALFELTNGLVTEMEWYHSVGIGDEPGDSATTLAGIDIATGDVQWWIPYSGVNAPPQLGNANELVAIAVVYDYPSNCTFAYGLDPLTGEQRWAIGLPGPEETLSAVALSDNSAYFEVAARGQTLTAAFDAVTGSPLNPTSG